MAARTARETFSRNGDMREGYRLGILEGLSLARAASPPSDAKMQADLARAYCEDEEIGRLLTPPDAAAEMRLTWPNSPALGAAHVPLPLPAPRPAAPVPGVLGAEELAGIGKRAREGATECAEGSAAMRVVTSDVPALLASHAAQGVELDQARADLAVAMGEVAKLRADAEIESAATRETLAHADAERIEWRWAAERTRTHLAAAREALALVSP